MNIKEENNENVARLTKTCDGKKMKGIKPQRERERERKRERERERERERGM